MTTSRINTLKQIERNIIKNRRFSTQRNKVKKTEIIANPRCQPSSKMFLVNKRNSLYPRNEKNYSICVNAKYFKILHLATYQNELLYLQFRNWYQMINRRFLKIELKINNKKVITNTVSRIIQFSNNEVDSVP